MQAEILMRTCDNPSCTGTGGAAPFRKTIETVTDGITDRPDIAWISSSQTQRSADNRQLNPVGTTPQFCQPSCCIAYLQSLAVSETGS
jgi:hypothetical protein